MNRVILRCRTYSRKAPKQAKQPSEGPLDFIYTEDGERFEVDLTYDLASDRIGHFWLIPTFVCWRDANAESLVYYCQMVKRVLNDPSRERIFERVGAGVVFHVKWFSRNERQFLVLV